MLYSERAETPKGFHPVLNVFHAMLLAHNSTESTDYGNDDYCSGDNDDM